MRFELIDRVLEREPQKIVAVKSLTKAEEYLADHFPGFPVMPGVMMLETLVQAARELLADRGLGIEAQLPMVLAEVRNIRYGNMVRPGQTLKVTVSLRKPEADAHGGWEFEGVGNVDDQVAVQGRFRMIPLPK